jgi:2-polyprenyl-3-methyl-5-hydroxy-6-metoxy-1,4-benzoquinol methylase
LSDDPSRGWERCARQFIASRSDIGVNVVRKWAQSLSDGASILDIGCGHGAPLSAALIADGFALSGVDASPTLVAEFRRRYPDAEVACEAAERSSFFGRTFDGAIAVGLVFLLPAVSQREIIHRAAAALKPSGRFLFTAPWQTCNWTDILTGGHSVSLGREEYERIIASAGMSLVDEHVDRGGNHYYEALKN